MTILDEGNNPILCIPNDNISIIGKARELMGKSKKVKGFFFFKVSLKTIMILQAGPFKAFRD